MFTFLKGEEVMAKKNQKSEAQKEIVADVPAVEVPVVAEIVADQSPTVPTVEAPAETKTRKPGKRGEDRTKWNVDNDLLLTAITTATYDRDDSKTDRMTVDEFCELLGKLHADAGKPFPKVMDAITASVKIHNLATKVQAHAEATKARLMAEGRSEAEANAEVADLGLLTVEMVPDAQTGEQVPTYYPFSFPTFKAKPRGASPVYTEDKILGIASRFRRPI